MVVYFFGLLGGVEEGCIEVVEGVGSGWLCLHDYKLVMKADDQGAGKRLPPMEEEEPIINLDQVVFPYYYGSLAFSLGKKGENFTHRWICYVRGIGNEDLSYLIEKVVFTLHSSFSNPVKEIYKPPFEIQEVGWGEFEILIRIHFKHPEIPPVEISHHLKLHHTHTAGSQQSKKPLCSQVYDEIVFTQRDEHIQRIIDARERMRSSEMIPQLAVQASQLEDGEGPSSDAPLKSIVCYSQYYQNIDPADHRIRLEDALRFIKGEISGLEEKMRIADLDIQKVYEDIYSKTS